jgi:hypothetical protein
MADIFNSTTPAVDVDVGPEDMRVRDKVGPVVLH